MIYLELTNDSNYATIRLKIYEDNRWEYVSLRYYFENPTVEEIIE